MTSRRRRRRWGELRLQQLVHRRELATQVDEDALGGLEAYPLDGLERLDLPEGDDAIELHRGVRAEDDARRIGSDARDAHEVAEELLLGARREAVEQMGVLTYDLRDEQPSLALPHQS